MEFKSILYADSGQTAQKGVPSFFQDLQLDYLLEIIEGTVKGYDIKPYYYTLPATSALISYRQQICKDLYEGSLCEVIRQFCQSIQKSVVAYELSEESDGEVQAATYHLQSANIYIQALNKIKKHLDEAELSSEGLIMLREYVEKHIHHMESSGFIEAVNRANEFFTQIRFQLVISEERITISEAECSTENFFEELVNLLGLDEDDVDTSLHDIYPGALEPSLLEATLVNMLRKSRPEIFKEIAGFHKKYQKFHSDILLRFDKEVQFYIGFMAFIKKAEASGYRFCMPDISSDGEFEGTGVYDVALVFKNAHQNYQVVSNDFSWTKKPAFFVVTGPNQGGKTTFARSLGQSVYFSMMGLYANGASLTMPYFDGIATHFEAEEVLQSNSGKLKEEINRLKPMMKQEKTRQFIILNELFTTATTHDALIMGRKVMEHFLKKQCYGIYVTHIQELADENDSIISLVAQAEDGEERRRTYRIMPMKAQGYGYSDSLVKQFELRYEDIVRRLS